MLCFIAPPPVCSCRSSAVAVDARGRLRLPAATEVPHADGSLAVGGPGDDDDAEVGLAGGAAQCEPADAVAANALDATTVDVGVDAHDPAVARLVDAEREAVAPDACCSRRDGRGGARRLEVAQLHRLDVARRREVREDDAA